MFIKGDHSRVYINLLNYGSILIKILDISYVFMNVLDYNRVFIKILDCNSVFGNQISI